jgi:hypothetical protein
MCNQIRAALFQQEKYEAPGLFPNPLRVQVNSEILSMYEATDTDEINRPLQFHNVFVESLREVLPICS